MVRAAGAPPDEDRGHGGHDGGRAQQGEGQVAGELLERRPQDLAVRLAGEHCQQRLEGRELRMERPADDVLEVAALRRRAQGRKAMPATALVRRMGRHWERYMSRAQAACAPIISTAV